MNNSERLLLYTLPRWAGVTALSTKELLSDMWIGGQEAGHHSEMPYDPDGREKLRIELLKDFVRAPSSNALGSEGGNRTVGDLDAAMANIRQTPVPPASAMLAALLPREELATLSRGRSTNSKLVGKKRSARQHSTKKK